MRKSMASLVLALAFAGCGGHDRTQELQQQKITLDLMTAQNEQLAALIKTKDERLTALTQENGKLVRALEERDRDGIEETRRRKVDEDRIASQDSMIVGLRARVDELTKRAGPTRAQEDQEFAALVRWIEKVGSERMVWKFGYAARLELPVTVNSQAHAVTAEMECAENGGTWQQTIRLVFRRERNKWVPEWDTSVLEKTNRSYRNPNDQRVDDEVRGWFLALLHPYLTDDHWGTNEPEHVPRP